MNVKEFFSIVVALFIGLAIGTIINNHLCKIYPISCSSNGFPSITKEEREARNRAAKETPIPIPPGAIELTKKLNAEENEIINKADTEVNTEHDYTPPKLFLNSVVNDRWICPHGNKLGVTVEQLVNLIPKTQLDNGSYPEVFGWTKNDNIYTYYIKMKGRPLKLVFKHILNRDWGPEGSHSQVYSKWEDEDGNEDYWMYIMFLKNKNNCYQW